MRTKIRVQHSCVLAAFLLGAGIAMAKDRDFTEVQQQIEAAYQVKPTHIPLMSVAHFAMRSAKPFAGHAFELALFEDVPDHDGWAKIKPPSPEWTLVIRNEDDRERTLIFARPDGKRIRVLLLAEERNEITLMESEATPSEFLRGFHSFE